MLSKLKWGGWVIAGLLFAILLLQRECSPKKGKTIPCAEVKPDTKFTVIRDTIVMQGKALVKTVYVKIPSGIDTASVLKDYFASRNYMDTIKGRDVQIVIQDSVSQNKLTGRLVSIKNDRPTEVAKPKTKVFVGLIGGFDINHFTPDAGLSVGILTKQDHLYSISYDAINRQYLVSAFWKIH